MFLLPIKFDHTSLQATKGQENLQIQSVQNFANRQLPLGIRQQSIKSPISMVLRVNLPIQHVFSRDLNYGITK